MKSGMKHGVWLVCGAGLLISAAGVRATGAPQLPAAYTNLQVLPKDITQDQLMGVMKGATQSLGVRCWYCHDGAGDDLSTYNFAADTKEPKATARIMLRLTSQLNNALKDVGPRKGDTNKITCQTCHRGNKTPAR
ncbi:MAG TPA: c-type cytochrome [Vicinamibacterales bacterium]|nr:c-type cytochrome [Vicinamibacterales bacterium]